MAGASQPQHGPRSDAGDTTPGGIARPAIVIVSDGKPGHLSQTRGLAQALVRRLSAGGVGAHGNATGGPVRIEEIAADEAHLAKWQSNALILSAGSKAAGPALALKRKWDATAVALMDPGAFRRGKFDCCVVPRHDRLPETGKRIVTEGALNPVVFQERGQTPFCCWLIGGPSGHHGWDTAGLLEQVESVLAANVSRGVPTIATDSRRTPPEVGAALRDLAAKFPGDFTFVPHAETPRGWVAEQLLDSQEAWVTEDSVSMVYEALTAGCSVGLLQVPLKDNGLLKGLIPGVGKRKSRVVAGIHGLAERGWVTWHRDWLAGWQQNQAVLKAPPHTLAEADRVAGLLLERLDWPGGR